jgi:hypothetical protein
MEIESDFRDRCAGREGVDGRQRLAGKRRNERIGVDREMHRERAHHCTSKAGALGGANAGRAILERYDVPRGDGSST